jgi:sulfite dehydrogenase (quinone) subunit SoeA
VRVRIRRAEDDEPQQTWPQFNSVPPLPGMAERTPFWRAWFAGKEE